MIDALGDLLPPLPHDLRLYDDEAMWRAQLARARAEGLPLAMTHVHAPEEVAEEDYVVPRHLLLRLNDKSRLSEIVDEVHLANRFACAPHELTDRAPLPCVVKAVDDESVSGGFGLRFCDDRRELAAAMRFFAGTRAVVVEERLDMLRSDCVHFAVRSPEEIDFLGVTPQLVDDEGHHEGNTIGLDSIDDDAIRAARIAVHRAAARGYVGPAALDVAILREGGVRVLDPNFRLNASTSVASLWPRSGESGALFSTLEYSGPFRSFIEKARRASASLGVIPLYTFDPSASRYADRPFLLRALLPGRDRAEIAQKLSDLARMGWQCAIRSAWPSDRDRSDEERRPWRDRLHPLGT